MAKGLDQIFRSLLENKEETDLLVINDCNLNCVPIQAIDYLVINTSNVRENGLPELGDFEVHPRRLREFQLDGHGSSMGVSSLQLRLKVKTKLTLVPGTRSPLCRLTKQAQGSYWFGQLTVPVVSKI